ncbi:transmembrane protein 25 isoform X7 [Anomalospiza imberbis]|uniref:transmembrane protein 25 isoform X7 n=1 Tax=Anomalospiza imberbis TaxID=187417 RepID=UPI00358DF68D
MDARSRAGARPCAACTALRAGAQAQSRTADWAGHRSSNAAAASLLALSTADITWGVPAAGRGLPLPSCCYCCSASWRSAWQEGQSRIFACWVPRPVPGATLAWYLNGQKQEVNLSTADTASILTLTGQRSDHQLNCSLTIPTSSETYNTSVLLNVQYKPEILREDAHYQQVESTGLLLVLFVLVQANPPASITWVDEDGHVMANTSRFLRLGANHSLHIHLSCTAGNLSISAANSVGTTTASLLPTGLLDARVELPVLSVAIGAALALAALLSLGSCAACLACRLPQLVQGVEQAGGNSPPSQCSHCSRSEPPQPQGTRLPRQTRSLPPNLRLGDLAQEDGASPKDAGAGARGEESALLGLENSLVLSKLGKGSRWASSPKRCVVGHGAPWLPQQAICLAVLCLAGFVQLPMSGRIYKVPSTSSDEIWL